MKSKSLVSNEIEGLQHEDTFDLMHIQYLPEIWHKASWGFRARRPGQNFTVKPVVTSPDETLSFGIASSSFVSARRQRIGKQCYLMLTRY